MPTNPAKVHAILFSAENAPGQPTNIEIQFIHAAMRADELMEAGDMGGRAVWLRIVKAIKELLAKERPEGEKVH